MPLFLNLLWILLFIPAWWVWKRSCQHISSPRCLMSLACALVILFPVVSANDDLNAAPQTIEESGFSKRSLKHGNTHAPGNHFAYPPAYPVTAQNVPPPSETNLVNKDRAVRVQIPRPLNVRRDRAPPHSLAS